MRLLALPVAFLMVACGSSESGDASPSAVAAQPASEAAAPAVAGLPSAVGAAALPAEPSPLQPQALELGSSLDADGRVASPRTVFRAGDSVHVSLVTLGPSPASMLRVQWADANDVVLHRDERAVTTTGPAVHTFSLTPSPGWLAGNYRVTVTVDGAPAGVREFEWR